MKVIPLASRIFVGQFRHENAGVDELSAREKLRIFQTAERYIERYGWYVDTETYRALHFSDVAVELIGGPFYCADLVKEVETDE